MNQFSLRFGAFVACATVSAVAGADVVSHTGSVQFESDAQPTDFVNLPKFNNMGGTRVLQDVLVELLHSGSVTERGDNDDPFKTASVRGRMIRQWDANGPDVTTSGARTITTPIASLAVDDNDGGSTLNFDPTPPDGIDFGTLAYSNLLADSINPLLALYDSVAGGTVTFDVTPTLMVNDQTFQGTAPDSWQLEVEDPLLIVTIRVTYTYEVIPAPGTMGVLALAGLAAARRRRV